MLKEFNLLKKSNSKEVNGAENGNQDENMDEDTKLLEQIKEVIMNENPDLLTKKGKFFKILLLNNI